MAHPRSATDRVLGGIRSLGQRRDNRAVRAAATAAKALLDGYERPAARLRDITMNGEDRVLRRLGTGLGVVFDVGANVGEWTEHALAAGAQAVHAFEISPSTSAELGRRFESDGRVVVNPFGLGSATTTITIHHYPDWPVLTTVTEYPHDLPSEPIDVPVRRGDDYVTEQAIDRIDLLKLDVEGAEGDVLHGLARTFERGAIGAVQFEYGRVSILTKYLLRDFYADLVGWGFRVGRIQPEAVEFQEYSFDLEDFADSNWLAVHEQRDDLLDLVTPRS
jgi:FkbM family methyltransferase